jgi:5-methylcytosine-specific restriction endonuclease McrA
MISDPTVKLSAQRSCLIGDHKERKADGGSDTDDNIQTLCNTCNNIKTMMNGDTIASKKKVER